MSRLRALAATLAAALLTGLVAAAPATATTTPVLKSISVDRQTLRSADVIKTSYAVEDDAAGLESVAISYSRTDNSWGPDLGASNLPLAGSFSARLSDGSWPGQLTAEKVSVMDANGNEVQYWRDGTVRIFGTQVSGRHTLDLAALDLTVTPNAPTVSARSRPRSAVVSWSVGTDEAPGITGYKVTVNPGGRVIDVPGVGPAYRSVVVTGLRNATPYTFTVVSQSRVGPGPGKSASATPLISGNVFAAGDVNGDRKMDLFAQLPNREERLYRGKGAMTFSPYTKVSEYGPGFRVYPGYKYFGKTSFLAQRSWDSRLEGVVVERTGRSTFGVVVRPQGAWPTRFIDGSADFTGDGRADIVAVTPTGNLYLYRSTSTEASYSKPVFVGRGWQTMQSVFASGDVTGDRRSDLFAVDSAGVLWIYPGTGKGTFSTRRKVSAGWGGLGGLFYARDLSGDGRGDLGAITMDGKLRIYKGRGNGTFAPAVTVSSGWAPYL
jgi:hypothetical protein